MKRLWIAAILAAGMSTVAGVSYAVNIQETVEMITHADLVMKDGGTMHADIVKMNGKMYLMVPVDDLPDYLHQQVLKVMPQ
jgi:hypothetical protein